MQQSMYSVNYFLPFRRLWPSLEGLHPYELHPVVPAAIACLLANNSQVLWVPTTGIDQKRGVQWVGAADACFVPQDTELPPVIVSVAKKAGLLVPDLPAHVQKVPNADFMCLPSSPFYFRQCLP